MQLTERQYEVAEAMCVGVPTKRLAHLLGISVRTVEQHRAAVWRAVPERSPLGLVRLVNVERRRRRMTPLVTWEGPLCP